MSAVVQDLVHPSSARALLAGDPARPLAFGEGVAIDLATFERQVRALARKSALNARARDNAVMIIDRFTNDEKPKTSRMLAMLQRLGVDDRKVLILTDGVKPNVFLSARNIPTAHVMPYSDVSTYHILWSDVVLILPYIDTLVEDLANWFRRLWRTSAPQASS